MMTIACVSAEGRLDVRETAACRGAFVGNVTGRTDRARGALVAVGSRGLTVIAFPMDFSRATPGGCTVNRVLEMARERTKSREPLNLGFQPAIGGVGGADAHGAWNYGVSPDARQGKMADDCPLVP